MLILLVTLVVLMNGAGRARLLRILRAVSGAVLSALTSTGACLSGWIDTEAPHDEGGGA